MTSSINLLAVLLLAALAASLSPLTVLTTAPTYTSGIATLISSPSNKVNSAGNTLSITFGTPAPSSSLNASVGVITNYFDLRGPPFGWKLVVASVSSTGMMVTFTTNSITNYIRLLSVCYMVNWNAHLNLNYALFTLNSATDPLANSGLSSTVSCSTPTGTGSCTSQQFSGIAYSSIGNIDTVRVFLAGVFMTTISSGASFTGLSLSISSITTSSFSLTATTYNSAQLSQFSIFHLSFDSTAFAAPYFVFEGIGRVGCFYTGSGCGGAGATSNSNWNTVTEPFNFYSPALYFYGLTNFIVDYDGTGKSGNFETTSTTLLGTGAYSNSFTFSGNSGPNFHMRFSYFFLLTASCPSTGDIYLVYNSTTTCDSTCNAWIGQYADLNNTCQVCHQTCYTCTGPLATQCTACHNYQNRVLSSTTCICDPSGFYDDGSSLVCPLCHYTCKMCTGPSSGQCTACESTYYRSIQTNTCPCTGPYYDVGAQICQPCHLTCMTCSSSSNSSCLSCYPGMMRVLATNSTCPCQAGYYDSGGSSGICSACLYSCATCFAINTNCTSCNSTNFRYPVLNTCPCSSGYFDNLVALCVACHPTCLTCNGPLSSNCLSCNGLVNRGLQGSTCNCFTSMYSLSNICTACHFSCLNCTAGTSTDCIACSSSTQRTFNNATKECLCNAGYYEAGTVVCLSCNYTCLTCSVLATNCTSCQPSYQRTLTGSSCPCNSGYVNILLTGACSPCFYSCRTCSGTAITQCTSCPSGSLRTLSAIPGSCLCPITGYYDDGTSALCQPCSSTCLSCISSDPTGCTSCDSTLFRSLIYSFTGATSGSCLCISGYYDLGSDTCSTCNPICASCLGTATNCTSCDSTINHRTIVPPNTCLCINGYYQSGATICPACTSPCLTCSTLPSSCTSCSSGRTLTNNKCICNAGTFENSSLLCQACSYSCATCVNSSTTCLSCPIGSQRTLLGTSCPCNTGFYDNLAILCLACSYSCSTCSGSAITCTSCPANSFRTLSGSWSCVCNSGYYDNGANAICSSCAPECLTCQSYSQCLTCDSSLFRVWDSVTFNCPCFTSYYHSSGSCLACHYSCLTCFAGTSTSCYTCAPLRVITFPNTCPCASGFYEIANSCSPCSLSCLTCSLSSSYCTSCNTDSYLFNNTCLCTIGYYLNGLSCAPCSSPCLGCTVTATICTSCDFSLNLILQGTTCVCSNSTYLDSSGVCSACNTVCSACSGSANFCTACDSALLRHLSGSQCLCISGYYDAGVPTCQPCSSQCLNCNGPSSLNCTACSAAYHLIGSSCMPILSCPIVYYQGVCLSACPSTTYASGGYCLGCNAPCLTCTSSLVCSSCLQNTFYYAGNSSCVYSCPAGTYHNNSTASCLTCPSGCGQCAMRNGTVLCSSCQSTYYFLSGKCVSSCPTTNYTHIIVLSHCIPCPQYCATCTALSPNACLTCLSGYYLFVSTCLATCPQGYQGLNMQCVPCLANCTTCLGGKCLSCASGYYISQDQCIKMKTFLGNDNHIYDCHPNCLTCTNNSFSSCVLCSDYRGSRVQTAISGYCDCWKGSIDIGGGVCSRQSYESLQQLNKALVSITSSANYFSLAGSLLVLNLQGSVALISYQQVYSLFYYINSSSLLQTDWILQTYLSTNIDVYLSNITSANNPLARLLHPRLLSDQTDSSLFLRGMQYQYLCEWALFSYVCLCLLLISVIVFAKMNKKFQQESDRQKKAGKTLKQSVIKSIFKAVAKIINQRLLILFYLLTLPEIFLYGLASFKILALSAAHINLLKLILSCILFLFYILYIIRMVYLASNSSQETRAICYGFVRNKLKSLLCRLYVPVICLRSMLLCMAIVLGSSYGSRQSGACLGIWIVSMVYSLGWCPYNKAFRVFLHLHELVMGVQIGIITASSSSDSSKLQTALFLAFFNYAQIVILIGLNLYILISAFCCPKDKLDSDGQVANNDKPYQDKEFEPEPVDQRVRNLTEDVIEPNQLQQPALQHNDSINNLHQDEEKGEPEGQIRNTQLANESIIKKRYRKRMKEVKPLN